MSHATILAKTVRCYRIAADTTDIRNNLAKHTPFAAFSICSANSEIL